MVYCVSPDSLGFSPSEQISESSNMHKQLHAFVSRHLNNDSLTIVDFSNHTKSFRYELFCIARERKTRFCVLYTEN